MPQDPLGLLPDQSVTNQEQTNNAASDLLTTSHES